MKFYSLNMVNWKVFQLTFANKLYVLFSCMLFQYHKETNFKKFPVRYYHLEKKF